MDRRIFLSASGALFTHPLLSPLSSLGRASNPSETLILGTGREKTYIDKSRDATGVLNVFNVLTNEVKTYQLPFIGHEIVMHPSEKDLVFVIGKRSRKAAIVNYRTGHIEVLAEHKKDNELFSGHALFTSDGKNLYCSEVRAQNAGFLVKRSSTTLEVVDMISTEGRSPHQSTWVEIDKVLLVANTNRNTSHSQIRKIDLQNKTNTVWFDAGTGYHLSHFLYVPQKDFVIVGGQEGHSPNDETTPTVIFYRHEDKLQRVNLPNVVGEANSLWYCPEWNVALTSSWQGNEWQLYIPGKTEVELKGRMAGGITGVTILPGLNKAYITDNNGTMDIYSIEKDSTTFTMKKLKSVHFVSAAHLLVV